MLLTQKKDVPEPPDKKGMSLLELQEVLIKLNTRLDAIDRNVNRIEARMDTVESEGTAVLKQLREMMEDVEFREIIKEVRASLKLLNRLGDAMISAGKLTAKLSLAFVPVAVFWKEIKAVFAEIASWF